MTDRTRIKVSNILKRWGDAFRKSEDKEKLESDDSKKARSFEAKAENKTSREEVLAMWRELVQRQRVHEMIKCLHAGKKKMEIMYNFTPDQDYIDFSQFVAEDHAKKVADHSKNSSLPKDAEGDQGQGQPPPPPENHPKKSSLSDTNSKTRLLHTQGTKTRNAAELLYNKANITDQEFEDILDLCEDKIEQKALREAFEDKKARQKYLKGADERRIMLYDFINGTFCNYFIFISIILSISGICAMTWEVVSMHYAYPLLIMDSMIIGVFLLEAILKILIYREDYFKKMWNVLDFVIVLVHFVEILVDFTTLTLALSNDINESLWFKFLKSLRALRLLRVIKLFPTLQVVVTTIFQSMVSIASITLLMLIFIFVFAVMGRGLFYETHPDKFGDLWLSFVFLFQMLTLDDWFNAISDVMNPQIQIPEDKFGTKNLIDPVLYWMLFFYLFFYLVIEYFVFLNLFVAVLVDNFQLSLADAEIQKQKEAMEEMASIQKFEVMKKEGIDPDILEEEHQRQLSEIEQLCMNVEDYFPVDQESTEAELLADIFKDMNAIDFERFLWKRRFTLYNMVADAALNARQTTLEADLTTDEEDDDDDDEDAPTKDPVGLRRKIRKSLLKAEPGKSILVNSQKRRQETPQTPSQ